MSCGGHCCCGGQASANVNDENLVSVFKQAVESKGLEFVKVIDATQQVVSGFRFRGHVEVVANGEHKTYEVDVWQKAGGKEIEVQSCNPQ